ncbi:hypothetical protein RJ639_009695 [Escallonia herrerae]|uniref:Reverse transcriptase/retrotransposon-derived protein RNase H-like domain-containing protein n=1 Tax=Escallonia herrerae TaxID=1293975 RepID=A0AA88VRF2_9ASTE|nr:hypothetical protein RJ639_009695 [Escallonia herrerae]
MDDKNFEWMTECETSFDALKEYLISPPLLSKPILGEDLFLYLAVAESAVSAVLVREQDEALIPIEVGLPSLRLTTHDHIQNEKALRANLDLLDESREQAAMHLAAYQHRVSKFYDQRVRHHAFQVGDLVLCRIEASAPREAIGKLAPNWEGHSPTTDCSCLETIPDAEPKTPKLRLTKGPVSDRAVSAAISRANLCS